MCRGLDRLPMKQQGKEEKLSWCVCYCLSWIGNFSKFFVSCDFIINSMFLGAELWWMGNMTHKVQWLIKQPSGNNVNNHYCQEEFAQWRTNSIPVCWSSHSCLLRSTVKKRLWSGCQVNGRTRGWKNVKVHKNLIDLCIKERERKPVKYHQEKKWFLQVRL